MATFESMDRRIKNAERHFSVTDLLRQIGFITL